jgi:hypothetical protein
MGSRLYEITCPIACSLARSTGWLSVVDRSDEKVDNGGEKVVPDENIFWKKEVVGSPGRLVARSIDRLVPHSLGFRSAFYLELSKQGPPGGELQHLNNKESVVVSLCLGPFWLV